MYCILALAREHRPWPQSWQGERVPARLGVMGYNPPKMRGSIKVFLIHLSGGPNSDHLHLGHLKFGVCIIIMSMFGVTSSYIWVWVSLNLRYVKLWYNVSSLSHWNLGPANILEVTKHQNQFRFGDLNPSMTRSNCMCFGIPCWSFDTNFGVIPISQFNLGSFPISQFNLGSFLYPSSIWGHSHIPVQFEVIPISQFNFGVIPISQFNLGSFLYPSSKVHPTCEFPTHWLMQSSIDISWNWALPRTYKQIRFTFHHFQFQWHSGIPWLPAPVHRQTQCQIGSSPVDCHPAQSWQQDIPESCQMRCSCFCGMSCMAQCGPCMYIYINRYICVCVNIHARGVFCKTYLYIYSNNTHLSLIYQGFDGTVMSYELLWF